MGGNRIPGIGKFRGDYLDLRTLRASPDRPPAGFTRLFVKGADGDAYQLEASGTETALAGGGATSSAAKAYHSTTQSHTTSGTYIAVAFDSEEFDTDTYHNNVTDNPRLVVPSTARYLIGAAITFAPHATGERAIKFRKNGTTDLRGSGGEPTSSGSVNTLTPMTTLVDLVAGDYVEVMAYQDSGGALNMGSATISQQNTFWIVQV